jgi:hypothetical protein
MHATSRPEISKVRSSKFIILSSTWADRKHPDLPERRIFFPYIFIPKPNWELKIFNLLLLQNQNFELKIMQCSTMVSPVGFLLNSTDFAPVFDS